MPQFNAYPALRARTFDLQDIQRRSLQNQLLQSELQRAQSLQHVKVLGRERDLKARIVRMQRSKAWGDLGDLKRELLDLWIEERNTLAKQVMKDIEAQRKQRRAAASARPREGPGVITIRPGGVAGDRQ